MTLGINFVNCNHNKTGTISGISYELLNFAFFTFVLTPTRRFGLIYHSLCHPPLHIRLDLPPPQSTLFFLTHDDWLAFMTLLTDNMTWFPAFFLSLGLERTLTRCKNSITVFFFVRKLLGCLLGEELPSMYFIENVSSA